MGSTAKRWGWRQRGRDPRFAGIAVLLLCVAIADSILTSGSVGLRVEASSFVLLVGLAIALTLLPPWRDTRRGPLAGAVVLASGGILILLVSVLVRLAR